MNVFLRWVVFVMVLSIPIRSFSAETVKFRHVQSIYFDEKGGGLVHPEGVACDEKSNLLIGDTGNDRLLRFTLQGKDLKAGAEIKIPQLSNPIRVQINSRGDLFALDGKKRRIVQLTPDGIFKGYIEVNGIPSPSAIVPRSFRIDSNNNVYILDIFSGRVLISNPEGKYQRQISFPKDEGFFSDLSVDSKGTVLLVDCIKARVYSAAKDSATFSPMTKSLKEYLSFPTGLTTDSKGIIYLIDENGGDVVILGQDGSFIGRQLNMGWNEGLLYYPTQICINGRGEAFIADRGNSRIQMFTLAR